MNSALRTPHSAMSRPGYKQTEVGVIPKEWVLVRLADVSAFITKGSTPTTYGFSWQSSGVLFLRSECVSPDGLDLAQSMFISTEAHSALRRSTVQPNDLLITITGNVGRVVRMPNGFGEANINQHIARIRIVDESTQPEWVYHFLSQPKARKNFEKITTGQAYPQISLGQVRKAVIPLPAFPEQRAIAEALSDMDGLLGRLDRLIAKKRDLKQAAMQQLLTGQTRLPGFHGDWQTKPLGELITHCFSGATPRRNRPDFFQGDIRWITSGELNYNVITDTVEKITAEAVKLTNLAIVPKGTFLMAITGLEAEGTRGACGIVGAPSTTNQSCMAVFPTSELVTQYLFYYYVLRGKSLALQYCQGTKQQSYTAKLVKQLPIAIPPTPAEQTAIAEVLTEMDLELAALEQRREKTRAIKQAMMQELLTGRIRLI